MYTYIYFMYVFTPSPCITEDEKMSMLVILFSGEEGDPVQCWDNHIPMLITDQLCLITIPIAEQSWSSTLKESEAQRTWCDPLPCAFL